MPGVMLSDGGLARESQREGENENGEAKPGTACSVLLQERVLSWFWWQQRVPCCRLAILITGDARMSGKRTAALMAGILTALAFSTTPSRSQSGAAAPAAAVPAGPSVNDVAPDFALPGATRYGVLQAPVRLSDLRGRTVVLAFFFQARTKG